VLTKLGVTDVTRINGKALSSEKDAASLFFGNLGEMTKHHMIFISCGTVYEGLIKQPGTYTNNLHEYVRRGGRLFATDYSYDYVEQIFPEFIDFEGGPSPHGSAAEPQNAAEKGNEGGAIEADVLDEPLRRWLKLPAIGALLPNERVQVVGFQTAWAVQQAIVSPQARTIIEGPVSWTGGTGTRPLTSELNFVDGDQCGRVVFSSYHTHGDAKTLLPQERVLEYLILEMGECVPIL
jgi:hypothetical protein